ncbi:MAG: hypothetical protein QM640_05195 [Niabella sp.]
MEYSLKRKSISQIIFFSSIDVFTDQRWRSGSYCLNYNLVPSILRQLNDNYNIFQVSIKGGAYIDYYFLETLFSFIGGRNSLVHDKNNRILYFEVENYGKPLLTFDGKTLILYEQLDGKKATVSISALSGIKNKNSSYLYDPLPNGEYEVNHPYKRKDKSGMIRNGVGYSMDIIPKFTSINGIKMQRTELRIHPDGNNPGSAGCIALSADKDVLNNFYFKMSEYIKQYGSVDLTVYDPLNPNAMQNKHLGKKSVNE